MMLENELHDDSFVLRGKYSRDACIYYLLSGWKKKYFNGVFLVNTFDFSPYQEKNV